MKVMDMYTIYERPLDYPEGYVVRRWEIGPDTEKRCEATYHKTIVEARRSVPAGLIVTPRQADDDPVIVESWF